MTRAFWRSPLALAGIGCALFVVVLDAVLRHLPGPASVPALFLGRFHPLAVHLPIGVILLVAAAEAASFFPRYRERVDAGIGLTLPVLLASALGAFLLGHLLARSGGFPARSLMLHRRMELFAVVGVGLTAVAWAYQSARGTTGARTAYRAVFGLTLAVLSGGAHFGGTMTRGDNYLSKYAPGFLAPLLGGAESREKPSPAPPASAAAKAEPLVLADVVLPILKERCAECHGEEKTKGELRLDSLAGLRRGGENGAVVVPGAPEKSPLFTRLLLPMDDDDRMPPEGKPGPTPAERDVIRFWIERGATDTLRVRDALAPANARGVLERALGGAPASSGIPAHGAPPPSGSATAADGATPSDRAPKSDREPAPQPEPDPEPTPDPAKPATAPASSPASPTAESPSPPPAPRSGTSAERVLAEKCAGCHGAAKQKGKLRVDSLDALLAGGKHGAAVVPGRPADSLLVRHIELPLGAEGHMPPKDKPQLTAEERSALSGFVRNLSSSAGRVATRPGPTSTSPAESSAAVPTSTDEGAAETTATASSPSAPANPAPSGAPPAEPALAGDDTAQPDPDLVARLPTRVDLFEAGVSALLQERCSKCHAGKFPAGNLSVAEHAALLRGGNGGPAVVFGELDKSPLFQRVTLPLSDGDHMPPEEEHQLTPDDVALLRAFILRGGPDGATVATAELSAGAVRALAARAPAASPPPPATPRSAGCGACTVGESPKESPFSGWSLVVSVTVLALRRRSRAFAD